jgi:diguanylate cyclase (GGDEF)-like protein
MSIIKFIKRYWLGLLTGSIGWIVTGIYLVEEYRETGSFSGLLMHLSMEIPLHHIVMISLIPLMMIIGYLYIKQIALREKLRSISITDELTGLYNRRGFFAMAEQQLKIAKRMNKATLLLSADMDNLKEINDTLGHKEGDVALIDTANILRKSFRESDIIARIGGDEFVVLQIEKADANANTMTNRLQNNLAIYNTNRNKKLSISAGTFYCEPEFCYSIEELLIEADKLMYRHKKNKQKL